VSQHSSPKDLCARTLAPLHVPWHPCKLRWGFCPNCATRLPPAAAVLVQALRSASVRAATVRAATGSRRSRATPGYDPTPATAAAATAAAADAEESGGPGGGAAAAAGSAPPPAASSASRDSCMSGALQLLALVMSRQHHAMHVLHGANAGAWSGGVPSSCCQFPCRHCWQATHAISACVNSGQPSCARTQMQS
jgi:hypothetical protein